MDDRPNRRHKAAFINFSGVVFKLLKLIMMSRWHRNVVF